MCDRACLNGVLWMLHTGEPWKAMPCEFGSRQTIWRRRREWDEGRVLDRVLMLLGRRRG